MIDNDWAGLLLQVVNIAVVRKRLLIRFSPNLFGRCAFAIFLSFSGRVAERVIKAFENDIFQRWYLLFFRRGTALCTDRPKQIESQKLAFGPTCYRQLDKASFDVELSHS